MPLRQEFARKLRQAIGDQRGAQAAAAKRLGITRQRLHQYLSGRATPGYEILCKAVQEWDLHLEVSGVKIGPMLRSSRPPARKNGLEQPEQLPLFPTKPVEFREATVRIQPQHDGTVQISVTIKSTAA